MINMVEELKTLVSIKSEVRMEEDVIIRLNYDKAASVVANLAERAGLDVTVEEVKTDDGDVIPSVIATIPGGEESLALVSHYDVVPASGPWIVDGKKIDPYSPLLIDGKLYGRGAADDKSAIVATISALSELRITGAKLRYKPYVVVTGDEEVGGIGIRSLLDSGYRWDKAVIVDAGADYLTIGASGVVHAWLRVKGRAGHAGYPHLADNPVEKLARLIAELTRTYKPLRYSKLSKLPSPPNSPVPRLWGRASFTIFKLGKNDAEKHNRIPSEAIAGIDVRLIPEEDVDEAVNELYSAFNEAAARLGIGNAEIEIVGAQRGWYSTDENLVEKAKDAVRRAYESVGIQDPVKVAAELGGNDGSYFFNKGIPVVAFGAIRQDNNIHAPNEFVYIQDLEMLKNFVINLLT